MDRLGTYLASVLFAAVVPHFYGWCLYSRWSIEVQGVPNALSFGSTSTVLVVLVLAALAGGLSVALMTLVVRIPPLLSASTLGASVLFLSEYHELFRIVSGEGSGRDFAAVGVVAASAIAGWISASLMHTSLLTRMGDRSEAKVPQDE